MFNKIQAILILVTLCSIGCQSKKENVVILDYSYNSGWVNSYSLKIYSDGHGYLKKNNLKVDSLFTSNQIETDSLTGIIEQIKQSKPLHKYSEYYLQDGSTFNALIRSDDGKYLAYYVYGDKSPEILKSLKKLAYHITETKNWQPIRDTPIVFSSFDKVKVVTLKLDSSERFLPPKENN